VISFSKTRTWFGFAIPTSHSLPMPGSANAMQRTVHTVETAGVAADFRFVPDAFALPVLPENLPVLIGAIARSAGARITCAISSTANRRNVERSSCGASILRKFWLTWATLPGPENESVFFRNQGHSKLTAEAK
jgi:hypothetical protein